VRLLSVCLLLLVFALIRARLCRCPISSRFRSAERRTLEERILELRSELARRDDTEKRQMSQMLALQGKLQRLQDAKAAGSVS
jgi:C4-dicarboxylate-specific signal transduction histidine kinase